MNSKNHKQNTNFQIAHFLVGSCHTPDGAYSLLCDLRESREAAINHYAVTQIRNRAKEIRAIKMLESNDEATILEGRAELLELENGEKTGEILYLAAQDEISFIDKCIKALQPLRKFKDLPDLEAHEAAQFDEWKFELINRAENYIITSGTIPSDQFDTMRMHPAFKTDILPRINEMRMLMSSPEGIDKFQKQLDNNNLKVIYQLLEHQE